MTHEAATSNAAAAQPARPVLSFDRAPRLVFWETTKACPLACVHCRATAQRRPAPGELTTAEGRALIEELAAESPPRPVLILTGGDCLQRTDSYELTRYAQNLGVPVAISPSVSPSLNATTASWLYANGVHTASLSLDGARETTHEQIRQVPGHFGATIAAIDLLHLHGFHVQINTAVMEQNVHELADLAALLVRHGVRTWEVFFLVGVGRGETVSEIEADQYEDVCHFLVDAAQYAMTVRTVEAPFFRRVRDWRSKRPGTDPASEFGLGPLYSELHQRLRQILGEPRSEVLAPTSGTRDGKGIVFVAHDGQVYPAGFLPLPLGSVRDTPVLEIYRESPVLASIRKAAFPGRCGRCAYADECGGSRARAYAATGDPLGDDPACSYVPPETTLDR
jgi:radical SAM protein